MRLRLDQQADGFRVSRLRREGQRRVAGPVGKIGRGAVIEQQLDHIRPAMTDRFGERRPAELIGLVRIGPLLKKPSDIAGAFGPGGVGKRSAGCGGLPCFEFFQAFGSREVSGLRRDLVPMASLRRISIRAPAIFVHLAEAVGRIRATRLGGAPIKLEGLGVVLRDAHAVAIEIGKVDRRLRHRPGRPRGRERRWRPCNPDAG